MNYEQFAKEQLMEATAAYVKARQDAEGEARDMTQDPRVWWMLGDQFKANMGAKYAGLFNSERGKDAIGYINSQAFKLGVVDAIVMVVEAFVVERSIEDKDEGPSPRNAPDRVEAIIATVLLKDRCMMVYQRLRDGKPSGEIESFGFDGNKKEETQSRFAPHLDT